MSHSNNKSKKAPQDVPSSTDASDMDTDEESKGNDQDSKDSHDDNRDNNEGQEDKEGKESREKIIIGMTNDTKDLYAKFDAEGNKSWSDKPPSDLEEAPENETTQKYAILVRKKKPRSASSTRPLEIDSLIIQSPLLKRALADIFEGYSGITIDVTRLKFHAPFQCFMHRWEELEAAVTNQDYDDTTREHLQTLYRILAEDLGPTIQLRKDYLKNSVIDFEHAWFLFPPRCTVLAQLYGQTVAGRFDYGQYRDTPCGRIYEVDFSYIDWDGVRVGWVRKTMAIPEFDDTAPIASLGCYPIDYHPDPEPVRAALRERGRRWEALRGFRYKAYSGVALYSPDGKSLTRQRVDCRVVLDGARWEDENPNHSIPIDAIAEVDNAVVDYEMPPLSDYHALLASPLVRGYALKNKRWMQFFVDGLAEIAFDEGAFESLVLSQERKDLVLAFAESQARNRDSFDDVVSGKGRGIIMLLSGGPGIGKTLTAEVVAEQMRVPLYTMSAGDLGEDASDVDDNLSSLMSMVSNWNAVLLLDECDVFLEERTAADLARNRIVSIFLRTLEYYEGILFLTTNRISNMDAAFQSRIHLTLEYPSLDADARRTIWSNFLQKQQASAEAGEGSVVCITEDELDRLARLNVNGRQIKNIMKMAKLIAMQAGTGLRYEHVHTVLRIQGHLVGE